MSSVRVTFVMPLDNLKNFLLGKTVNAWMTHPRHDPNRQVVGTTVEFDAEEVNFEVDREGYVTLSHKHKA